MIPIESLPPLPIPRYDNRRRETLNGIFIVLSIILLFVSLTHGVALTAVQTIPKNSVAHVTILCLIYTESIIALLCLFGILYADPGVVYRSKETCYPIPKEVQPYIRAYVKISQEQKEEEVKDQQQKEQEESESETNNPVDNDECRSWKLFPNQHLLSKYHLLHLLRRRNHHNQKKKKMTITITILRMIPVMMKVTQIMKIHKQITKMKQERRQQLPIQIQISLYYLKNFILRVMMDEYIVHDV